MRLMQTNENTKTDTRWQLGLVSDNTLASQSAVITAVFVWMQSGKLNAAVGDGSRRALAQLSSADNAAQRTRPAQKDTCVCQQLTVLSALPCNPPLTLKEQGLLLE